jgi:hypothetical protein
MKSNSSSIVEPPHGNPETTVGRGQFSDIIEAQLELLVLDFPLVRTHNRNKGNVNYRVFATTKEFLALPSLHRQAIEVTVT